MRSNISLLAIFLCAVGALLVADGRLQAALYPPSGGGGGSGTVTSVTCAGGLTGGTITTSGTCSAAALMPLAGGAFTGPVTSNSTVTQTNNSVGITTVGIDSLVNTAAATSGAANQQWSPGLFLGGQQWDGAADKPVGAYFQERPITSTTNGGAVRLSFLRADATTVGVLDIIDDAGPIVMNAINGTRMTLATHMFLSSASGAIVPENHETLGNSFYYWGGLFTTHMAGATAGVPTCVAGTGAGTSGSPTCTTLTGSTDLSGTLEVVSQTAPAGSGAIVATVTFHVAYDSTPRCSFVAADTHAAAALATTALWVDQANGSTTTFIVKNASVTGLAATTTFDWNYVCIQ